MGEEKKNDHELLVDLGRAMADSEAIEVLQKATVADLVLSKAPRSASEIIAKIEQLKVYASRLDTAMKACMSAACLIHDRAREAYRARCEEENKRDEKASRPSARAEESGDKDRSPWMPPPEKDESSGGDDF